MSLLLPLLIGAIAGGLLGLCAGWLARGREEVVVEKVVTQTDEKMAQRTADEAAERQYHASEILSQLQHLTTGVSARIDAHSRTVGDINDELSSAPGRVDAVLAAIQRLVESNNAMQSQLQVAQTQLAEQASLLEARQEEARTDPLTRLKNRRAFDQELARRVEPCAANSSELALLMLDVDHFKRCNDSFGHPAGDEVLRMVSRLLIEKASDIPGAFAARYGGEELVLLLSDKSLQAAAELGEEIRRTIEQASVQYAGRQLAATVSVGAASRAPDESTVDFIARADEALYAAKRAGRNCLYLHEEGRCCAFEKSTAVAEAPSLKPEPVPSSDDVLAKSIGRRLAEWRRGGAKSSLIVCRIDNLAALGGQQRDRALQQTTEVFKPCLREMDQLELLAGENFGILLPTAQLADAVRAAERMRSAAERSQLCDHVACDMTLSFGVAEAMPADDAESLLLRARRALEAARRRGGNAVFVNDGVYSVRSQELLDLVAGGPIA